MLIVNTPLIGELTYKKETPFFNAFFKGAFRPHEKLGINTGFSFLNKVTTYNELNKEEISYSATIPAYTWNDLQNLLKRRNETHIPFKKYIISKRNRYIKPILEDQHPDFDFLDNIDLTKQIDLATYYRVIRLIDDGHHTDTLSLWSTLNCDNCAHRPFKILNPLFIINACNCDIRQWKTYFSDKLLYQSLEQSKVYLYLTLINALSSLKDEHFKNWIISNSLMVFIDTYLSKTASKKF